jgi:soluble lytic murein transglycosylase-like protein
LVQGAIELNNWANSSPGNPGNSDWLDGASAGELGKAKRFSASETAELVKANKAENVTIPDEYTISKIWNESRGDPFAENPSGAKGLGQMKEIAAKDVGWKDYSKEWSMPSKNIYYSTKYMQLKVDQTGSIFDGFMRYGGSYKTNLTIFECAECIRTNQMTLEKCLTTIIGK